MHPFTEYYRLRSFSLQADGSFSYWWFDLRFLEIIAYAGRSWRSRTCVGSLDKDGRIHGSLETSAAVLSMLPPVDEFNATT